jgi:hypothetical protein
MAKLARNVEIERLGGLEIDGELEPGRLHVGRLLALENPSRVDTDLAERISQAGGVAHQASRRHVVAHIIARGQCVSRC